MIYVELSTEDKNIDIHEPTQEEIEEMFEEDGDNK